MTPEEAKKQLADNGYVVIPDVLTPEEVETAKKLHDEWRVSIPNHDRTHTAVDPHGIYKFHEAGHQRHAWFIRTNPRVQSYFKALWQTEDLISSFDGSCYISKNLGKKDNVWTHTDQAPASKGLKCYQGLVALTSNKERTLVVYKKSHLEHEKYFQRMNNTSKQNWQKIDIKTVREMECGRLALEIPAGALVLWDSRTFHQNQYGAPDSEERVVQYVCFFPKSHPSNTKSIQNKRKKYFLERRTTSHWPAPIYVNGKQPQTYGDTSKQIDYTALTPPQLDDLMEEIEKLL
jgi:hypothetical protein